MNLCLFGWPSPLRGISFLNDALLQICQPCMLPSQAPTLTRQNRFISFQVSYVPRLSSVSWSVPAWTEIEIDGCVLFALCANTCVCVTAPSGANETEIQLMFHHISRWQHCQSTQPQIHHQMVTIELFLTKLKESYFYFLCTCEDIFCPAVLL